MGENQKQKAEQEKAEQIRRIDEGYTQNRGNGSREAAIAHDLAYWGIIPRRYL